MEYLLALDRGTFSSRAIVFSCAGQIVASAQQEFPQHFPQPDWVEHDPFDIWNSQLATRYAVLKQAKLSAADMAALSITNRRETTMVWERATDKPIFSAIVWQDRRTEAIYERLRAEDLEDRARKRTDLIIDPYSSATKLRWILDRVDDARERATRGELAFSTIGSWLVWQLTRGRLHVAGISSASRMMLWNIHTDEWDADLMRALDIHPSLLPEVRPPTCQFEQTDADQLGTSLTISGIAGDQQSTLFGQACSKPGIAKDTYGTGCFMLFNTGDKAVRSHNGLINTTVYQSGTKHGCALEDSAFVGDTVVWWLRDSLRAIQRSADVGELAISVPDSDDVVFVPSFTGLEVPYWDPTAQGAIIDLSRGTTIGRTAHVALGSIASQSMTLLQTTTRDAISTISELRIDGSALTNNLLLQFQTDLLSIPVVRSGIVEATALGAVYLAGIATDFYHDKTEVTQ